MHSNRSTNPPNFGGIHSVPTSLNNIKTLIRIPKNRKPMTLPPNYTPSTFDVRCGRGKRYWNEPGNVAFRKLVQSRLQSYLDADTKSKKTAVVLALVDEVKQQGGHFLKIDSFGRWYDIGDDQARDKVGHSLRDQVTRARLNQKDKKHKQQKKETKKEKKTAASKKQAPKEHIRDLSDVTDAIAGLASLQQPATLGEALRRSALFRSSIGSIRSIEFDNEDDDNCSQCTASSSSTLIKEQDKKEECKDVADGGGNAFAQQFFQETMEYASMGFPQVNFDISQEFTQKATI